jgi:hypothetical protein
MDVAFGWVALGVIPIVVAVSVLLTVLLARGGEDQ